jgi:CRP-like cAMP-binding protein
VTIVPSFFFGSVLCYIAAELMMEWLIDSRETCSKSEYGVVWVSFVGINLFGVEIGMLFGILAQILAFVFMYARSGNLLTQRYWHSNVIRGFKQRSLSSKLHKDIVTLELHGFVFFGSAVRILEAVKRCCFPPEYGDASNGDRTPTDPGSETPLVKPGHTVKCLLLDFYHVTGLDSTGAATCFLTLRQRAEELGMTLVFCHVKPHIRHLLEIQKVLPPAEELEEQEDSAWPARNCPVQEFSTADEGLEWCETMLLQGISSYPPRRGGGLTNSETDSGVAEVLSAFLTQYMLPDSVAGGVVEKDRAIEHGPGSNNPFGPPPRASEWLLQQDEVNSLGMRHRNVPSRRALASLINDESDDDGRIDSLGLDTSVEAKAKSSMGGGATSDTCTSSGNANRKAEVERGRDIGLFFVRTELNEGDVIYEKGALADSMFILESGACEVVKARPKRDGHHRSDDRSETTNQRRQRLESDDRGSNPATAAAGRLQLHRKLGGRRPDRGKLLRYESGTIFGEVEFFLRHKRYFTIRAAEPCVIHKLDWRSFDRLQLQRPQLACAFHTAVMRWACRWVAVDINDGRRHHGADRFMKDIEDEDD